jgi:hypothetical protein
MPNTEIAAASMAELPQEDRQVPQNTSRWSGLVAGFALVVAAGVGVYSYRLQTRAAVLQTQLIQTRATAQAALETVNTLKIPKDLSADVASLEVTANKLRAAEEALRRSFNDEIQKIPALDARLSGAHSALAARQAETEKEVKTLQEKNDGRLTTIITVLKNQDKILRRLADATTSPTNEE